MCGAKNKMRIPLQADAVALNARKKAKPTDKKSRQETKGGEKIGAAGLNCTNAQGVACSWRMISHTSNALLAERKKRLSKREKDEKKEWCQLAFLTACIVIIAKKALPLRARNSANNAMTKTILFCNSQEVMPKITRGELMKE